MSDIIRWNPLLRPQMVSLNLRGQTIMGGASLTGRTQVALLDAGYWVATLGAVVVSTRAEVLAFRSMVAMLRGGATMVRVPAKACAQAPWPGSAYSQEGITHSDDTTHSDGTGYAQPIIDVALSVAAVAGDSQVTANVINAGTILPGMLFTLGDGLHVIRQILSVDGAVQQWAVSPRVRASQPVGAFMDFEDPTCLMRLTDESSADLNLVAGKIDTPDVMLTEVIQQ